MWSRTPLLLLGALLGLAGCGGPRTTALDTCLAQHGDAAGAHILPACVNTEEGPMATDGEYIAGVVECELGWLAKYPAALMAQAVAARTYLAAYLDRKGPRAEVPIGAHFQCWRQPRKDRSRIAAEATADIVLHYQETLINGNYVSGARALTADCTPEPPTESGYRHRTWQQMRDDYLAHRARGKRRPYSGIYWTEVLVTRNAGRAGDAVEGTPFASPGPKNRGALGQYAAACLAEKGYDTQTILKYFYGEDIALSRALPDAEPPGLSPLEDELPDLDIPPVSMALPAAAADRY